MDVGKASRRIAFEFEHQSDVFMRSRDYSHRVPQGEGGIPLNRRRPSPKRESVVAVCREWFRAPDFRIALNLLIDETSDGRAVVAGRVEEKAGDCRAP